MGTERIYGAPADFRRALCLCLSPSSPEAEACGIDGAGAEETRERATAVPPWSCWVSRSGCGRVDADGCLWPGIAEPLRESRSTLRYSMY